MRGIRVAADGREFMARHWPLMYLSLQKAWTRNRGATCGECGHPLADHNRVVCVDDHDTGDVVITLPCQVKSCACPHFEGESARALLLTGGSCEGSGS